MKLIELAGASVVYKLPDTGDVVVNDRMGGEYILDDMSIGSSGYDAEINHIEVAYKHRLIRLVESSDILERKRGQPPIYTFLVDGVKDGCLKDNDKEIIKRHIYLRGDEEVVMARRKMSDGVYYIFLYEGDSSPIKAKPYDGIAPTEYQRTCGIYYTFDRRTRTLSLLNENLDTVWEFQASGDKAPIAGANYRLFPYKNTIIANLSADHGESSSPCSVNGRVYCLDKSNGSIVWEKVYTYQINDIAPLDEGRFLGVTYNQLLVLDSENGDVLNSIDVGLPTHDSDGIRKRIYLYLIATENYIIIYDTGDSGVLHIYDKVSLECLRQISCHEHGFELKGATEPAYRIINKKIFLEATRTDGSSAYLDNLFMIDLDNINAPVEVEVGPDFDIHIPDEENGCLEFRVKGVDWQNIVRFAERHIIRNLIFVGRGALNEVGNPFFNAMVKLIIQGCQSPRDVLESKLDVMDKRLKWFFNDKYALHDEPVTIDYIIE